MAEYDLTTRDGMAAWLQTLPEGQRRDAAAVIAARAAARVMPLAWGDWAKNNRDEWRHIQLSVCRAILSSAVAAVGPTDELRSSSSAAYVSAYVSAAASSVSADAAASAADAAYAAAASVAYASAAAYAAAEAALLGREGPATCLTKRLWLMDSIPDALLGAWTDCHISMEADRADWSFWIDWYQGWLEGRLPPRALAEEIVTSKDINWRDPVAANAKIVEIWKRHQAEAKPAKVSLNSVTVKAALDINKAPLGDQLDALAEMIAQEYERTRGRNPCNELEEQERARALGFFEKLNGSVLALSNAVAEHLPGEVDKTEEVVPLLSYYRDLFADWPRANAPELVDSSSRIVLVAICAGVGGLAGAPIIGAMIGSAFFGAGKVQEAIAAVKSAGSGG